MPDRVLVDSSVWIDLLNDRTSSATTFLAEALRTGLPRVVVGDLVAMEVLRVIRDDARFDRVRRAFGALDSVAIVSPGSALRAAHYHRSLRTRGISIRSSIDCLIAMFCIDQRLPLLHTDRDFVPFEEHLGLEAVPV